MVKAIHKKSGNKKPGLMIAGWREWVSLPDLDIRAIKIKLDTGARTSALHARNIRPFLRDGKPWVRFEVNPVQRGSKIVIPCEAPVVSQRSVRSSSGQAEERYVIKTTVRLGDRKRVIEVTLTNRDEMGFRMLLGRSAMTRWLMVDSSKSFLQGKKPPVVKNYQAEEETRL